MQLAGTMIFNKIVKAMKRDELTELAKELANRVLFTTKEVLTSDETAKYMGVSKSYLYKLTMHKIIPHYKPTGKVVYFNRLEIEQWLQKNRVSSADEIKNKVNEYCAKGGLV